MDEDVFVVESLPGSANGSGQRARGDDQDKTKAASTEASKHQGAQETGPACWVQEQADAAGE